MPPDARQREEWLWGWDPTPGIVSVWATDRGVADRLATTPRYRRARSRDGSLSPLAALRPPRRSRAPRRRTRARRHDERTPSSPTASSRDRARCASCCPPPIGRRSPTPSCAARPSGSARRIEHVRDLDGRSILALPPDEQYLVATGRTYFRDLPSTISAASSSISRPPGSTRSTTAIFLIAVRTPDGADGLLEARSARRRRRGRPDPRARRA